jgi:hypothetical protein
MMVAVEQDEPPEHESVVVETVPKVEGVPLPVQYAKPPIVGMEEVETLPLYRSSPSNPSKVPVQFPEVFRVKAPPVFERPEPKSVLKV